MSLPVTIENDALRMEVWPHLGGKVASLIDKSDKFELFFNYPTELPTRPQYDASFQDSWYAGWDECFPAVAASPYAGHPYNDVKVPDHGELWGLPTTPAPTKHGITITWHGLRFGYTLTRQLELDGPSLVARYTLVNLAPFPFRFVWAMHALMALAQPATLELPGGTPMRFSHDAGGNQVNKPFAWPVTHDGSDLSRPAELPPKRGWKVFSQEPITSPVVARYLNRGRSMEVAYASDDAVSAYWGIWVNTGGWAGHHHFAIEPTTGRFDEIDKSILDKSAGRVGPNATVTWSVRLTVRADG